MILYIFTFLLLFTKSKIYQYPILNSSSFTNYNQDFATCICNLKPNFCDIFCCCDQDCQSNQISSWTANKICIKSNLITQNIYNYCSSSNILQSFQNINCLYFDNKNQIGKYYPDPSLITSSNIKKMSSFGLISSSIIASSTYVLNSAINKNKTQTIKTYKNYGNGFCSSSPILIGESYSDICMKQLQLVNSTNNCNNVNNQFSIDNFCITADCTTTKSVNSILNVGQATNICTNVLQSIKITVQLNGNQSYIINNISITATYNNITKQNGSIKVPIKIKIQTIKTNISKQKSGAPGYILGKKILFTDSNFAFIDLSLTIQNGNGNCLTSNTTDQNYINFLQPATSFCKTSSNNSFITNFFSNKNNPYFISRYGDNSVALSDKDVVSITYNQRANQSIPFKTVLNCFYSISGTSFQPQNYIVSASITYQQYSNYNKDWPTSISVKWIYVNPNEVNSPVNNNFYKYFEMLWAPINNIYTSYSKFEYKLIGVLVGIISLILY